MGTSQQFSLRWNNYLRHITNAFDSLRNEEDLVDVTLSCEGKRIRAHKMLLSACSTYFRDLFKENPCQHPVIIFRNVKFEDLAALIDFMYQGEVNVVQDQLASFLTTAELLAVQGLSEGNGKDGANDQPKEVELPDSPILPTEPEVQLSNNQKSGPITSTPAQVASPLSFFPVDQRSESPPSSKRRKWSSGVSSSKTSEKEESERRKTARQSSPDPIEIIPVVPNLKLEMPDYMEQEQDASSCSYSDSNQGAGVQGGSRGESSIPAMSQLLAASDGTGGGGGGGGKHEPSEIYSTNSGDSSLPPPAEGLSASDISQILAKPGPSGEQQSQDSLQGPFWCNDCGWKFRHRVSLVLHRASHSGRTKCPKCGRVFSRMYDVTRHLVKVHNIEKQHHRGNGWRSETRIKFTCNECNSKFNHKESLFHHRKIHRGETLCPVCLITFSRVSNLKRHILTAHSVH